MVMTLVITLAIAVWLHSLRADVAAFNAVRIFLSFVVFQDYPAALWMLAITPLALVPAVRGLGLRVMQVAGVSMAVVPADCLRSRCRRNYRLPRASPGNGRVRGCLPVTGICGGQALRSVATGTGRLAAPTRLPGPFPRRLTPDRSSRIDVLARLCPAAHAVHEDRLTVACESRARWVAVFLIHRLALRLTGNSDAAGLAALLTIASPAVTINAISLYSMTAHLVCNTAFVLLLLQPTFWRAVLAGLIGSLALVLCTIRCPIYSLPLRGCCGWLVAVTDGASSLASRSAMRRCACCSASVGLSFWRN